MYGGVWRDDAFNESKAFSFCLGNSRNGAALAFASNDDNAALAGLIGG